MFIVQMWILNSRFSYSKGRVHYFLCGINLDRSSLSPKGECPNPLDRHGVGDFMYLTLFASLHSPPCTPVNPNWSLVRRKFPLACLAFVTRAVHFFQNIFLPNSRLSKFYSCFSIQREFLLLL